MIAGIDPDPANLPRSPIGRSATGRPCTPPRRAAAYVNMMMDEGQDRVRAAYRGNYDRLVQVKRRYDPHNLFRFNQNIAP